MSLSILTLTDFSDASLAAHAVARAAFPAARHGLLHVAAPVVVGVPGAAVTNPDPDERPQWYAAERDRLQRLGGGMLRVGDPAEEGLACAQRVGAGLIVVGTAGRRGVSRLLLGSVAERLIREATVPVLSVREGSTIAPGPVRRVLILTDFSPASRCAHDFVRTHLPDAETHLVHVLSPGALDTPVPVAPAGRGITAEALVERNRLWTIEARTRLDALGGGTLIQGDPAEVALDQVREGGFDLIAMGTSGTSGFERLLFGSVAARVVRESSVPVLTARATG